MKTRMLKRWYTKFGLPCPGDHEFPMFMGAVVYLAIVLTDLLVR